MRIGVYLSCAPFGGGAFQYSLTILDALQELNYQTFVIFEHDVWKEYAKDYDHIFLKSKNITIFKYVLWLWKKLRMPLRLLQNIFSITHPLIKQMKSQKCDFFIFPSQDHWPYLIKDFKTIATIHDLMHIYENQFPEVNYSGQRKIRDYNYLNLCKYSTKVLVDSNCGKQHVLDSYGQEFSNKIYPLHFTIPNKLKNITPDLKVLEKRSIKDSNFIFYPAQFWKHKNHSRLIEAFKKVLVIHPDLKLILVGSRKNAYFKVKEKINNDNLNNSVHILGYVNDSEMVGLYKLAKALIMPTFFGPSRFTLYPRR